MGTEATAPVRLRQVCLLVADIHQVIDDLSAVLGARPCKGFADLGRHGVDQPPPAPHTTAFFRAHGLENAILPVGEGFVELVSPVRADTAAARHLARRAGDCGYMVIVEVGSLDWPRARAAERGVRLVGGADYPQYRDLHLDPRDTGGAMLCYSLQVEGAPFDGGWYPAGPDWRRARAPGIHALEGVGLLSGRSDEMVPLWRSLLGRRAIEGPEGRELSLDEGVIVFGEGTPDRLESIRLRVDDPDGHVLSATRRRLPVDGRRVRIGGAWFDLRTGADVHRGQTSGELRDGRPGS